MTKSRKVAALARPLILGGLVLAGALCALVATARPAPPANGLLVYVYYQNGVAVGGEVFANCPPGSPVPQPWGVRTNQFSWSYAPCF